MIQTSLFDMTMSNVLPPARAIMETEAAPAIKVDDSAIEAPRQVNSYSLSCHRDFFIRLGDGVATLDEYRDGFRRLTLNEAGIKTEIAGLKKDEIFKLMGGTRAYMYKSEKKERCIHAAYDSLIMRYTLHRALTYWGGEKASDAVVKMVGATTEKDLQDYAAEIAQARADYKARIELISKALKNPETLEEFELFIRKNGDTGLSAEQRVKYDELVAGDNRAKAIQDREAKAVARPVEGVDADMTISDGMHTKKHVPIWTVSLSDRVDRSVYVELKQRAKKLGGYYSSFRGNGAIPGFIFSDKESAEKFAANDQVSVADQVEARKDEKKHAAAQRLKAMAEKLEAKGNSEFGRERLSNTNRRTRMAASAEAKASADIALAKTMRNLAEAIESGQAVHLEGLRTKAQVEMLGTFCERAKRTKIGKEKSSYSYYEEQKHRNVSVDDIDCAEWPEFTADKGQLLGCVGSLSDVHGGKGLADILVKKANGMDENARIALERHLAEKIMDTLNGKGKYAIPGWWDYSRDELKRLDSMGIQDLPTLRAALREYVQFQSNGPKVDRAKQLERQLAGCSIPGFFPTPKPAVYRLIELAGIEEEMDVLEPEAGNGNIAEAVRLAYPGARLSVIEINSTLREILKEKGFTIVGFDFLDHAEQYDRIIMNPPFESGQDMEHIRHAYSLLQPQGRVVAICSEGPFFRSDRQAVEFRAWLDEVGGETEDLDAGTFMDRTQVRTTGVKSRIVVVDKRP